MFAKALVSCHNGDTHVLNALQGHVGQDTLTTMIRKDELAPSARRRRLYDMYATYADNLGKSTCPGGKYRFHSGDRFLANAI